ncbi:MAG: hypothetical protein VCF24_05925 [Candidatus Latescibacterota bacterium]
MAVELKPVAQQPRANGFMWGSKGLGVAGATAGGAWIISFGLGFALFGQAIVVGAVMFIPLLTREHPGERLLPWTSGQASEVTCSLQLDGLVDIGRSLLRVVLLPVSLVAAIVFFAYNLVRGFLDALLPVLTVQEVGWAHTDYSELSATAGLVSGLLGMVGGGLAGGASRTLLAGLWSQRMPAQAFVSAYYVLDTLVSIAFLATMMAIFWKRLAATQFSHYMALANMGLSDGAALLGPLQEMMSLRRRRLRSLRHRRGTPHRRRRPPVAYGEPVTETTGV